MLLAITYLNVFSQQKATTDDGKQVWLYDNGEWEYADSSIAPPDFDTIATNPKEFKRTADANQLQKSNKCDIGFYYNSKKWTKLKAPVNPSSEFSFKNNEKDLYATIIAEQIEVPLDTLAAIAITQAKTATTGLEVAEKEYRTVNGKKVLMVSMTGTIKGIKFTYLNYYYSGPSGSVQILTFTAQNLFKLYRKDAEDFLNGLVAYE